MARASVSARNLEVRPPHYLRQVWQSLACVKFRVAAQAPSNCALESFWTKGDDEMEHLSSICVFVAIGKFDSFTKALDIPHLFRSSHFQAGVRHR